jgi:hypothetical protein
MRTLWPLFAALLAPACATQKCPPPETKVEYVPQRVEVSVPVRCKVVFPARPAYALEDPALKDKTSFDKTTAALVEIEQRRAYEEKLEAALKVCADLEQ